MEELKKLNDATDFSGMTQFEKYCTILKRYENAFPDLPALFVGVTSDSTVAEHFCKKLDTQCIKQNVSPGLYQIYRGYDKMTPEEKFESIQLWKS